MDESSMTNDESAPRVLSDAEVDDLEKKIRPTILRDDGILDADARWFRVPELLHSLREARRERDDYLEAMRCAESEVTLYRQEFNAANAEVEFRTQERDAARAALRSLMDDGHFYNCLAGQRGHPPGDEACSKACHEIRRALGEAP